MAQVRAWEVFRAGIQVCLFGVGNTTLYGYSKKAMENRVNLAEFPSQATEVFSEPPVATKLQCLPLARLGWDAFERLCVRIAKAEPDVEHAQGYGLRGQNQEGIDLYVRRKSTGRYIVWQCKRQQAFSKADVVRAVRKFLKAFRTGQAGVPVKEAEALILAVTADLSDRVVANEIERQNKRLRRLNLSLVRVGWDPQSSGWPAFVRLHVAWSHGGALHRAFQTSGAPPESLMEWFRDNSQDFPTEHFSRADSMIYEAANPTYLKWLTVLLKGLASACGSLSEAQVQELRIQKRLSLLIETQGVGVVADMWADRTLGGNLLASYLSDQPGEALRRLVGEPDFSRRLGLQSRPIAEAAMKTLLENPGDVASRNFLHLILGERPIYSELKEFLPDLINGTDFVERFTASPEHFPHFMVLMSQLATAGGDQALIDKVWSECLKLAAHCAAQPARDEKGRLSREGLALSIADISLRLSAGNDSRREGARRFMEKVMEVARHWPQFAQSCGLVLDQALARIPAEEVVGYPHLSALLRSRI